MAGAAVLVLVAAGTVGCTSAGVPTAEPTTVSAAVFNVRELTMEALRSGGPGGVGDDPQLLAAAAVVQRVRPDVLVVQEIDLDREAGHDAAARLLVERYLNVGAEAIDYPHLWVGETNTGVLSGFDLDRDGRVATPADLGTREHGGDSWGFGTYPGQYSMAVLSRFPIDERAVRSFRGFRWVDLPGHRLPTGFYPEEAVAELRLSSKAHWDVPVVVGGERLHLLISHPTPPGFDGPEDRNGRRNADEIALWLHYLDGSPAVVDDAGVAGGLPGGAPFVLLGDLNADPEGEPVARGEPAIAPLLRHPRLTDPPAVRGVDTADFRGGMRVDYALPSVGLEVVDAGVFGDPSDPILERALALAASDHRLVWVEVAWPPR